VDGSAPYGWRYRSVERFTTPAAVVPLALPDVAIAVADLLPWPRSRAGRLGDSRASPSRGRRRLPAGARGRGGGRVTRSPPSPLGSQPTANGNASRSERAPTVVVRDPHPAPRPSRRHGAARQCMMSPPVTLIAWPVM
jgi:hypothetical protein